MWFLDPIRHTSEPMKNKRGRIELACGRNLLLTLQVSRCMQTKHPYIDDGNSRDSTSQFLMKLKALEMFNIAMNTY